MDVERFFVQLRSGRSALQACKTKTAGERPHAEAGIVALIRKQMPWLSESEILGYMKDVHEHEGVHGDEHEKADDEDEGEHEKAEEHEHFHDSGDANDVHNEMPDDAQEDMHKEKKRKLRDGASFEIVDPEAYETMWADLRERIEQPPNDEDAISFADFYPKVFGGTWAVKHLGIAFERIVVMTRSHAARWRDVFKVQPYRSLSLSTYDGETNCHMLARGWVAKQTYTD